MHDDIKKWKKLFENTADPAELLIQDPRNIGNIDEVDPAVWKNHLVKKSVLQFILAKLKSQKPRPVLDVYFKLLNLYCHWPELDIVKKYLSDMSIAAPLDIAYYFENTTLKNKEIIQQKIYEIIVEWLNKYGTNVPIEVETWSNPSRKWSKTSKFAPDYYNVNISYNPWVFELYEQGLLPPDKTSIVEKYADLVVDAYEKAIKQYSGTDYNYKLGGIDTLKKFTTKPEKISQILYKQIGQIYQYLNSRQVVDYINSIKDENQKRDEMRTLGELIARVLTQLKR